MGIYQILEWLGKFFSVGVHLLEILCVLVVAAGSFYLGRRTAPAAATDDVMTCNCKRCYEQRTFEQSLESL